MADAARRIVIGCADLIKKLSSGSRLYGSDIEADLGAILGGLVDLAEDGDLSGDLAYTGELIEGYGMVLTGMGE